MEFIRVYKSNKLQHRKKLKPYVKAWENFFLESTIIISLNELSKTKVQIIIIIFSFNLFLPKKILVLKIATLQ